MYSKTIGESRILVERATPTSDTSPNLQAMHDQLMHALGAKHAPLNCSEYPIYIAAQHLLPDCQSPQGQAFNLVSRTVRPDRTRLQERTAQKLTVAGALENWLKMLSVSMASTTLFMLAGVANVDPTKSSGQYTTVQMVRFIEMITEALEENKSLTIASTPRSQNCRQAPSSHELLTRFTTKYLTGASSQTLGTMLRPIPTQLFATHIPRCRLAVLKQELEETVSHRLR